MNPELQRINTQLGALSKWMETPSQMASGRVSPSPFADPTTRDTAIKNLDEKIASFVQSDWELWEGFKKDISHSILIDRVIQNLTSGIEITGEDQAALNNFPVLEGSPLQESFIKLKGIWDGFQETQQVDRAGIEELKNQVKDAIALEAQALQAEIASFTTAAPRAQTPEELTLISDAEAQEDETASLLSLLSTTHPTLSKVLNSLTRSIADGKYGPKVTKAFEDTSEEVIADASFLKIVLIEDAKQLDTPHTLRQLLELPMTDDVRAEILALRDRLRAVAQASAGEGKQNEIPTLESLLGLEDSAPLSETGHNISNQLNGIVSRIQIQMKESDEKTSTYALLVCNTLETMIQSSGRYQEAFDKLESLADPYDRAELLVNTIRQLKSSDPKMFFKATTLALENLEQIESQGFIMVGDFRSQLLDCLLKELATPPKISEAFLQIPLDELRRGPLWKFISLGLPKLITEHPIDRYLLLSQTLVCKELTESLQPETLFTINSLIYFVTAIPGLVLSTVFFQTLLRCNDERVSPLLPKVAGLVPLQDRFQCFTQLAHIAKEKPDAVLAEQLALQALDSAKKLMQMEIFNYLAVEEKTPEAKLLIKDKLDQLCEYLNKELQEIPPSENMKLDLITKLIEEEIDPVKKMGLTTLFIPQLLSMDKKSVAMSFARDALNGIALADFSTKEPLLTDLFNALSDAIPTQSTLSQLSPEAIAFKQSYLEVIQQVTPPFLSIKTRIQQAAKLQPIDPDFSAAIAAQALKELSEHLDEDQPVNSKSALRNLLFYLIEKFENVPSIASQAKEELDYLLALEKATLDDLTNPFDRINACIGLIPDYMKVGKQEEAFNMAQKAFDLINTPILTGKYPILQTAILKAIKDFQCNSADDTVTLDSLKDLVFTLAAPPPPNLEDPPEESFRTWMSFLESLEEFSFEPPLYEELASEVVDLALEKIKSIWIAKEIPSLEEIEGDIAEDSVSTIRLQMDCLEKLRKKLKRHLPSNLHKIDADLRRIELFIDDRLLKNAEDLEDLEDSVSITQIELRAFIIPLLIDENKFDDVLSLSQQAVNLVQTGDLLEQGPAISLKQALSKAIKKAHEIGNLEAKSELIALLFKTIEKASLNSEDNILQLINLPEYLEDEPTFYKDRLLRDVSAKIAKETLQKIRDISSENIQNDKKLQIRGLKTFCEEFSGRARITVKEAKKYLKTVETELFNMSKEMLEQTTDINVKITLLYRLIHLSSESAPGQALEFGKQLVSLPLTIESLGDRARINKKLFEELKDSLVLQSLFVELVLAMPEKDQEQAFRHILINPAIRIEVRSSALAELLKKIETRRSVQTKKEQLEMLMFILETESPLKVPIRMALKRLRA